MSATHFYVNGALLASQDAQISVLDHGFTVADGVFETLQILDGKVFALQSHLDRLQHSANGLGIPCPAQDDVTSAVFETLNGNPYIEHGRLRITVTSGNGPLGSDRADTSPTLVVTLAKTERWPPTTSAVVVPWIRNERSALMGLKTTSYAENVVCLELAHKYGFSEALLCDSLGRVSEGTGSNVFYVFHDELVTPAEHTGLLRGITREFVLELAAELGIRHSYRDMDAQTLASATEMFLTSSTRNVHPVTRYGILHSPDLLVTDVELPVGPVTHLLQDAFMKLLQDGVK